jgi:hypothetical protein
MTTPPPAALPEREPLHPLTALGLRSAIPAELRTASGMQKLDWILSRPDPAEFVTALAPQEFYYWLRDIGRGDAYPLLEFATRTQLQALTDIDAWHRHELSVPRWLEWLDLALANDVDTGLRFLKAQDDTTYAWLFSGDIQVLPADTDLDAIPDELAFFQTPDGMYVVTVPREHPLEDRMPQLLRMLWAADMDRARTLFQQVQFELNTASADELERFRSARLQDLGFEPHDVALEVFSVLPLKPLRESLEAPGQEAHGPPRAAGNLIHELAIRGVEPPSLLKAAVAALSEREREAFGAGFGYLANKVFMAETGDLSRLDDLPEYARFAAATCNLGISYLAHESEDLASRVLTQVTPEVLFRAGWSLLFPLVRKARRIARQSGAERGFALFGSPTDEALHAAQRLRPLWPEILDDSARLGHRPIETLDELSRLEARVDHAASLLDTFERRFGLTVDALEHANLPGMSADSRRRIRLTTLVRTGLLHALLAGEFRFTPTNRESLSQFAKLAFDGSGQLSPALSKQLARLQEGGDEALAELLDRALTELQDALGTVAERDLDLRYAGELFLVAH